MQTEVLNIKFKNTLNILYEMHMFNREEGLEIQLHIYRGCPICEGSVLEYSVNTLMNGKLHVEYPFNYHLRIRAFARNVELSFIISGSEWKCTFRALAD